MGEMAVEIRVVKVQNPGVPVAYQISIKMKHAWIKRIMTLGQSHGDWQAFLRGNALLLYILTAQEWTNQGWEHG